MDDDFENGPAGSMGIVSAYTGGIATLKGGLVKNESFANWSHTLSWGSSLATKKAKLCILYWFVYLLFR